MLRTLSRNPQAIAVSIGLVIVALATIFGPVVFADAATARHLSNTQAHASWAHPFGTDELGRDLLARVIVATRLSVLLTLGSAAVAIVGGVIIGVIAAVLPRALRRLLTALIDILLSFPWLLLALFFSVIWGTTAVGAMLAIGFAGIPVFARLVSTLAASVANADYVHAARILGVSPVRRAIRHVIPNILPPLLVNMAAHASVTLLSFAALSFLGLGVQAPEFDWGRLLNDGAQRIYTDPMAAIGPGIAIVFTGVVFSLAGEVLSEKRSRAVHLIVGRGQQDQVQDSPDLIADVTDLHVSFRAENGTLVERVHGVGLTIGAGEVVGIVGESGSGKSVTAMALAGLLGPEALVTAKRLTFRGIDMGKRPGTAERRQLGLEQAMIFQDPLSSLNPTLTIGRQLREALETHGKVSRSVATERAVESLDLVRIPEPRARLGQLPHEFSGGMRQRAMIAMGLMGSPRLIIADEPTTALDVTVQRQVIRALHDARQETGAAILLISHDIALVSGFCDRIIVMRDGVVVEELATSALAQAQHPYTRGLIACVPDMTTDRAEPLPVIGVADTEEVHA